MPKNTKPVTKKSRKKTPKSTQTFPAGPLIATLQPAQTSTPVALEINPKPADQAAPVAAFSAPEVTSGEEPDDVEVLSKPITDEPHTDTPPTPLMPPAESQSAVAEKQPPAAAETTSPTTATTPSQPTKVVKPVSRRKLLTLLLLLAAIAAAVFGIVQFQSSRQASADDQLIAKVAQRVVLPTSEKPTVTTVVDETKVNQPFLANSKKGDKVLLYFQEGRAVVYRPSTGQVVNMGPLVSPAPRVQLRNGTNASIPLPFRNKLTGSTEYVIASQDSAVKKDYAQTIVVDVTGKRPDVARRLAVLLGAKVAELPANETRPDADMLVIVGADAR